MKRTDPTVPARAGAAMMTVARPPTRVATRLVLPALVVLSAAGLLAYAARGSLRPAVDVRVTPAVLAPSRGDEGGATTGGDGARVGGVVVQAAGWVEADPYAVSVPALTGGTVREVLVLEGDTVAAGDVVARLVDEEAGLADRAAAAVLAEAGAALAQARAVVGVEEARAEEAREDLRRREALVERRAIPEGEVTGLRLRLAGLEAGVAAARAAVDRAGAAERLAQARREEAALMLERTRVRAPAAGVVLERLVEPGQRLVLDADGAFAGVVARLYDPAKVQVRVDVPLADAGGVRAGDTAEVTTEAFAGRAFAGVVTRLDQTANIQKNTLGVKVAITDSAGDLRPGMLARVRLTTRGGGAGDAATGEVAAAARGGAVLAPAAALHDVSEGRGWAWVVDVETGTVVRREVRVGRVNAGVTEVIEGLAPGDRLVVDAPAGLTVGAKVRASDDPGRE